MPSRVWVLIAIAVIAMLALFVSQSLARRRTAELQARAERRKQLEIRPLPRAAGDRYLQSWRGVQAQFVDEPRRAVEGAGSLIRSVMLERGYPVADFDQRAAEISVDHPQVVENYRRAHRLAHASAGGKDRTEDLRQAMHHYRALFDELVDPAADEPTTRDRSSTQPTTMDRDRSHERTVR